jgi:hypothetical protein
MVPRIRWIWRRSIPAASRVWIRHGYAQAPKPVGRRNTFHEWLVRAQTCGDEADLSDLALIKEVPMPDADCWQSRQISVGSEYQRGCCPDINSLDREGSCRTMSSRQNLADGRSGSPR